MTGIPTGPPPLAGNRPCLELSANGLNFHVQQAGSGPDVVLIHGLTGDLSIWFLSRTIRRAGPDAFRVTAYDLRGHGYTDAPAEGYTSLDHAHDLLGLLDVLDIDQARLVGHSFGAVIAVHAAVIAPERVEALVLSDPYFPACGTLEDVSRWGHWQNFRKQAEEAGVALSADTWYDLTSFFDQVLHLDDERLLRFRQAVGLPGLNRVLRLATNDLRPRFEARRRTFRRADRPRVPALPGSLRRELAVPDHGRLPDRAPAGLPGTANSRRAASRPRRESRGVRRGGARIPGISSACPNCEVCP